MTNTFQHFAHRAITGEARNVTASTLRAALALIEPLYSLATRLRNRKYDRGKGVRRLPRPVVSVGNITTGGTGKTPVVRWLCDRLRTAGHHPAVLMRGYGAKHGRPSDEQAMLDTLLNTPPADPPVIIQANPDRHAGGLAALTARPQTDVFVMDDGFQHRRLARDFDLVLIDAANPFGHGHVLPRGLLREPLSGLRRADAFLITRADQGDVTAVTQALRRHNPTAPIYRAAHALIGLRTTGPQPDPVLTRDRVLDFDHQTDRPFFAFAGIGNPQALARQLTTLPAPMVGHRWFADHWNYSAHDLTDLTAAARQAGAAVLLTTEKDWVKVRRLTTATHLPIVRLELAVQFQGNDETNLLAQIESKLRPPEPPK